MLKPYYQLPEGSGNIFTLPFPISTRAGKVSIHSIGTINCDTCIGLYFPPSDNKCFAAHIFPYIASVDEDCPAPNSGPWIPSDEQGRKLIEKVCSLLHKRVASHLPSLAQRRELREKAIVVCPRQEEEGCKTVGHHVLLALEAFFAKVRVQNAHGFDVDHRSSDSMIFGFTQKSEPVPFDADVLETIRRKSDEEYG